jgi:hypothetical protein
MSNEKDKLLKVVELKKEEILENLEDDKIRLIYPINCKLISKEEYDKAFNVKIISISNENKLKESERLNIKRTFEEMSNSYNSHKENPIHINKDLNPHANFKAKKMKTNSNVPNILYFNDPQKKIYSSWSEKKLEEEINKINKSIKDLEEEESKNTKTEKEIQKFEILYEKWLKISQNAVHSILDMFPQNQNYERNTIKTLIEHFKIDHELIKYDEENEDFKE